MNVFVAGFHHETNTFAPSPADWPAFECDSGYSGYARGGAMLAKRAPGSLAIGGFVEAARARGWALTPSVWAGAMPSNRITADAFERICDEIVEDASRGGFDAVYLDLHGAAVAEGCDDAEGELLQRLRAVVGPDMPVLASLDLHANVTGRMLRLATAMAVYRTYPHVDMRETGARAAAMLARRVADPRRREVHALRVPFLLPLNAQCTLMEPAASMISLVRRLEAQADIELDFAMGFSAADFAECGPVVFGYGLDAAALRAAVAGLHAQIVAKRGEWALDLLSPAQAVQRAMTLADTATQPVIVADTQDNPGAGGDSNTTGMLHALLEAGAGARFPGRVAVGMVFDPQAAASACAAGVGATLELSVGRAVTTFSGQSSAPPVVGRFTVRAVHDGALTLHGPMTAGATAQLGPTAAVEIGGVQVLLTSRKVQLLDLDLCRCVGVEPAAMAIIVVKSSVHFRAAFAPLASHILVAKAAGPMAADPGELPWRQLPASTAPRP